MVRKQQWVIKTYCGDGFIYLFFGFGETSLGYLALVGLNCLFSGFIRGGENVWVGFGLGWGF